MRGRGSRSRSRRSDHSKQMRPATFQRPLDRAAVRERILPASLIRTAYNRHLTEGGVVIDAYIADATGYRMAAPWPCEPFEISNVVCVQFGRVRAYWGGGSSHDAAPIAPLPRCRAHSRELASLASSSGTYILPRARPCRNRTLVFSPCFYFIARLPRGLGSLAALNSTCAARRLRFYLLLLRRRACSPPTGAPSPNQPPAVKSHCCPASAQGSHIAAQITRQPTSSPLAGPEPLGRRQSRPP